MAEIARHRTLGRYRGLVAALAVGAAGLIGALPGVASAAETTVTNNLSFPVIWGDSSPLTLNGTYGSPVFDGATATATDGTTELYLQGDPLNVWQAQSTTPGAADGLIPAGPLNVSQIDWGDNLESKSWSPGQQIRVEATLYEDLATTMLGFTMMSAGGSQSTEVFGTTKATYQSQQATIYSACARLTIQRLDISRTDPYVSQLTWDPTTGAWVGPPKTIESPIVNSGVWSSSGESGFASEVNGSGMAMYGYNWKTDSLTAGDYRLTFSLDPTCPAATLNTFLTSATSVYVTTTETTTETASATALSSTAVKPLLKAAASGSGGGGSSSGAGGTAVVDGTDNLSYMDVELGTPTYAAYVPVPVNTSPPALAGSVKQGGTVSTTTGTWDNAPSSYSYQWEDGDASGATWVAIPGATAASYTLTANDVGRPVRVEVTATNATGSGTSASAPTAAVAGLAKPKSQMGHKTSKLALQLKWLSPTMAQLSGFVTPRRDGHRLMIQQRTRNGWKTVATIRLRKQTRDRSGFTLKYKLSAGVYRAVIAGDATWAQSMSKLMTVRALVRLTATLHRIDSHHMRLTGIATPAHNGQRLMIQLRIGNGWKNVTSALLRQDGTKQSQYGVTLTNAKAGSYRVYLNGDQAHRGSASSAFKVG
ncbi:MAG: hypothetical protein ACYC0H_02955 [Solirubrobacteraceae bacterium]